MCLSVCLCRINNCVGEDNHWLFLQLCFYTQVLSLYTLVLDFCQYYYFQPLVSVDKVRAGYTCVSCFKDFVHVCLHPLVKSANFQKGIFDRDDLNRTFLLDFDFDQISVKDICYKEQNSLHQFYIICKEIRL